MFELSGAGARSARLLATRSRSLVELSLKPARPTARRAVARARAVELRRTTRDGNRGYGTAGWLAESE